jgi:hypothetical protein
MKLILCHNYVLPEKLGLKSPKLISITPDRPNIFLEKKMKLKSNDVMFVYDENLQLKYLSILIFFLLYQLHFFKCTHSLSMFKIE